MRIVVIVTNNPDNIAIVLCGPRPALGWDLSIGARLFSKTVAMGARNINRVIQQMAMWGQMLFRKIAIWKDKPAIQIRGRAVSFQIAQKMAI